jgi:hypothetical protein
LDKTVAIPRKDLRKKAAMEMLDSIMANTPSMTSKRGKKHRILSGE